MSENAEALAERLVAEWLEAYMFAGRSDRDVLASDVAHWFNDHQIHQSHGLGIGRDQARDQGVVVDDLEDDEEVQDLVLSVFQLDRHLVQPQQRREDHREPPRPAVPKAGAGAAGGDPSLSSNRPSSRPQRRRRREGRSIGAVFPDDSVEVRFLVSMSMAKNDIERALHDVIRAGKNDDPDFSYRVRLVIGHLVEAVDALNRYSQSHEEVRKLIARVHPRPSST